jgi:hypothetical protein
MRVSANAEKDDYISYLRDKSRWLHEVDRYLMLGKDKDKPVQGINEFMRDFRGKVRG